MKEIDGMKFCPKCKETQPVSEFYRNAVAKDGLQVWCKSCQRVAVKRCHDANRARNVPGKAAPQ